MRYRVRTYTSDGIPLVDEDLRVGKEHEAADEAAKRAREHGYDAVSVFDAAMLRGRRGTALRSWVRTVERVRRPKR